MRIPVDLLPDDSRPFDVVGLGLNSFDLITVLPAHPDRNSKMRVQLLAQLPGGQVATAIVACARLGWRTRYIGRFGDDHYGTAGVESLQREGVDTVFVQRVSGAASQFAVILVDEERRERTALWYRDPALDFPRGSVPANAIREGRILHVDGFETGAAISAAGIARQARLATVIDVEDVQPDIEALLDQMDVIVAAESFPRALTGVAQTGQGLAVLADRFRSAAVVCVTLGEQGSLARCLGHEIATPAFRVDCVDTTGAGDAFRAGFIAGWLKGGTAAELEDVLRYANAVAALKCRALGAREATPRPNEVEALLALSPPG